MRRRLSSGWIQGLAALLLLGAVGVGLAFAVPLPARLSSRHSVVVEYRDGTPAHVFLAEDDKWRAPVEVAELDPAYVSALIRFEDKRFYSHAGVDPLALVRAAALNTLHLERISGGSTLTMQLVRVLEPRPRTFLSKAVEALRAMQLELRLGKGEILAAYLQFVPFGRNLEGVESASLAYFGHRATHLSAAEIATLLAVPQNPNRRYPVAGNLTRLQSARDSIARRLLEVEGLKAERGGSVETALAEITATPVPAGLRAFPREAPHAASWLRAGLPTLSRIRTTLDGGAQRTVERLVAQERPAAEHKGIHNTAVVLVDHGASEVRALVGSFDFFDPAHGGQIPAFAVPRSPGSALKPLLYALAIDRGLVNPQMLVPDVPVSYGAYAPKNFDGQFSGLVRLEDALSRSLNLPFVALLDRLGVDAVLGRLGQLGVRTLSAEPGYYGLSMAVGGIELTPLELAGIFSALAEDGRTRPLRYLASAPEETPVAVYAPGAAWLTRQALRLRDRPDFPERQRLNGAPPGVHWKTGTSFGHRDAWSAGSLGALTAVVWMGNVDNSPSVHLLGSEAAGPLMFDVLEALAPGAGSRAMAPDARPTADLTSVEVCAYSGHLAGEGCEHTRQVLALRRAVPTTRCPYHRALEVDLRTGEALTPSCRATRPHQRKSFVVWPPAVRRYLREQDRLAPGPPPFAKECETSSGHPAPAILSPAPGQIALLLPGVPAEDQEIPLEADAPGNEQLTWFVNGKFLATAPPDERVWWTPSEGTHEIYVADSSGLSSKRMLTVRSRAR